MKQKTRKLAVAGLLTALAMILSYIEFLIPFSALGIPGLKLGLANAVTLFLLYEYKMPVAFAVSMVRILLSSLLFGIAMLPYSLAGGIFSFFVMLLLKRTRLSIVGVSMAGGVAHNIGQLLTAALIVENLRIFYYLPILLPIGAIMGCGIGIVAKTVRKYHPQRKESP